MEQIPNFPSGSLPPCVFSCRIVSIDYYLESPLKNLDVCFSDFRSSPVDKVPVVRIFGATPVGQKSCLHVHGAFPYLLVPCVVVDPTDSYLQQLARSIDIALQVSLGASSRAANHVFKIVVVKGVPFYGYHETEELFLRIYLINPGLVKRLADLLLAGAVMNQVLQPHESHIPFPLQFMIDYNLFGMHHIHLSAVKFRVSGGLECNSSEAKLSPSQSKAKRRRRSLTSPLLSPLSSSCSPSLLFSPSQTVWDVNTLPSNMILCEPKRSVTELEVDVLAADILNRHELSLVSDGYPGLAAIWEEERQRRQALNIDDPLSPPPSPERGSQPYHPEELRLREIFDGVLTERLGTSADLTSSAEDREVSQLTPSDEITFTQSCDLDLHQPIESEREVEPVAMDDQEVLIDEEAIKQSMELSQRISKVAIERTTDAEMLELLAELCQTPPQNAALSQSQSQSQFCYSSQSVGEQLTTKVKRSHSIISARSLFSSDSQDESSEDSDEDLRDGFELEGDKQLEGDEEVEGEELEEGKGFEQEKLLQNVERVEGREFDSQMEIEGGDELFIAMETELDNRKFSSPVVKISPEPRQSGAPQLGTPQRTMPSKVDDKVTTPRKMEAMGLRFGSHKSPRRHVAGVDTDEESEVELPISTPLASPIPPSPNSKALQSEVQKELDSFGSSGVGRDFDEFSVSQFNISFSQIQTPSSQCDTYSKKHPELEKVWNSTVQESSSKIQSPLRLVTAEHEAGFSAKPQGQSVQLEYEMPEITASQLETSPHHFFNPLETDSQQSSLGRGRQISHQQQSSLVKVHGVPTTLPLCRAKRQLLPQQLAAGSDGESGALTRPRKGKVSIKTRNKSKDIPQLDGVNDEPSSSCSHTLSRKRKRTLGMQRTRKRRRKSRAPSVTELPTTKPEESCDSVEDEPAVPGCVVEGEEESTASGKGAREEQETVSHTRERPEVASAIGKQKETHSGSTLEGVEMTGQSSEEGAVAQDTGTMADGGPCHSIESEINTDATSEKREASYDESQQTRVNAKRRLSLKKPVQRMCRTREGRPIAQKSTNPPRLSSDQNPSSWQLSKSLKARALRDTVTVRVDKLSHSRTKWRRPTASNSAAVNQQTHHVEEPTHTKVKSGSRGKKRAVTRRRRSESEDGLSTKEREFRYVRRCRRRSASRQCSPVLLHGMSFTQQLKKAIEMSKESYVAESVHQVPCKKEEGTERDERVGDEEKEGGGEEELSGSRERVESPLMFSPPFSDDLNRTFVEESPLRDEGVLSKSDSDYETEAAACADSESQWKLDMSISSISESPPYTSSPHELEAGVETEGLCFDSALKLQLETSFTDPYSPQQSSSPLVDKAAAAILNVSFGSDGGFPVVTLPNEFFSGREAPGDTKEDTVSPLKPTTAEVGVISRSEESQDYLPPVSLSPASLVSIENQLEVDHSQEDISIGNEDSSFHLVYNSDSEEEMVGLHKEGRESSECLDISTEKTTSAVRFAEMLSQNQLAQDKELIKESDTATRGIGVAGGDAGEMGWVCPALAPPTVEELYKSASAYNLPSMHHQGPFYSCPTDVQRPLVIGGRSLRVPSKMPYDLKEFHVVYSRIGESENVQFSSLGLEHMRTVLAMVSSGTQPVLPPICHPPTANTNKTNPYTFEDYKRDVEVRASFFNPDKVVITPALPPPHPSKFATLLVSDMAAGVSDIEEKPNLEKENELKKGRVGDDEGGGVGESNMLLSVGSSPQLSSPSSLTTLAAAVLKDQTDEEILLHGKGDSRKSPSLCRSDVSLDGSIRDSSLTSYQVPGCHDHSTPMVSGEEARTSVEEEEQEEEELSLTPVRKKNEETSKPRPLLPFTPIPAHPRRDPSQLDGPTPNNAFGFKVSQSAMPGSCDNHDVQFLTCMSMELHVRTRASLRPDPEFDPILALFYYIHNDWPLPSSGMGGGRGEDNTRLGIIAIDVDNCGFGTSRNSSPMKTEAVKGEKSPTKAKCPTLSLSSCSDDLSQPKVRRYLDGCALVTGVEVTYVSSEVELIEKLIQLVRQVDPDFLIGYEITMASWGYLTERAAQLNANLTTELSRMPGSSQSSRGNQGNDSNWKTMLNVTGRIMFGVWRLLRHEVALNVYSYENVAYHILHQRVPNYSFKTLTSWYDHPTSLYRHRVLEHYLIRCQGNHQLLERFNLIGRTSEFARLYGIEFESVVNRGSQYRVESMMLRLAKPANFVAVSPSVQQRARMAAPECLPLILEPESKFYADPVLVLDFQSLYPSMVIAYNYCFSTCLGRVHHLATHGNYPFGASSLNVPSSTLKKLKDKIHISPNGIVFVKHHVRKGILPTMLDEILGTRIMVKASMKKHKQNKALERMLNARQLGLKLIANTTYGYTGASFSGRMPCIEVADSIVRKGRETLERAIQMVNSSPEWHARVVYGDTDSLFVLLKGVSKKEAFRIGKEICERVTADNPKPVKLKFEKVYLPCILQTKKRYVGFMYESEEQKEPEFDAKGIETVRRDGCPAVAKILEKSLRLLFSKKDVSQVKRYIQQQFMKVAEGRVDLKDYTFAKEYRGRQYYRPGAAVPALELTKLGLLVDRRSEPRVGERVPYVIVYGTPGQPLIQLVKKPEDLLANPGLRLNGDYYITKQLVPALDRCFSLLGVDVRQWYTEMPQVRRAPAQVAEGGRRPRGTIGQYFATMHCPVCEQLTVEGVCPQCRKDPAKVAITLSVRMREAERTCSDIENICYNCTGTPDLDCVSACISLDCPVNYRRYKATQEKTSIQSLRPLLSDST